MLEQRTRYICQIGVSSVPCSLRTRQGILGGPDTSEVLMTDARFLTPAVPALNIPIGRKLFSWIIVMVVLSSYVNLNSLAIARSFEEKKREGRQHTTSLHRLAKQPYFCMTSPEMPRHLREKWRVNRFMTSQCVVSFVPFPPSQPWTPPPESNTRSWQEVLCL